MLIPRHAAPLLACLILGIAGCRPAVVVDDAEKLDARQRVVELESRTADLLSASAVVTIAAQTGGSLIPTSEHGLAFSRPDFVYMESYGPMGELLTVTRVNDQRMAVYFNADKIWAEGAANAENVGKLLGSPVEIGLLARALLAEPLLSEADHRGTIRYVGDTGDGLTRLAYRRPDGSRALLLTLEPGLDALREQRRFDASGSPDLQITYRGYTTLEDRPRPGVVVFDDHQGNLIEVTFIEQTLNPDLPENIFDLTPPPGARIIDLDAFQPAPRE